MSGEWDSSNLSRVLGRVAQPRLIPDLLGIEQTQTVPHTRTRNNFWREDILSTGIRMRDIFPGSQQGWEVNMLREAWKWFSKSRPHIGKDTFEVNPETQQPSMDVPISAVLNVTTLEFFNSGQVFKQEGNVPVAHPPMQMSGKMT